MMTTKKSVAITTCEELPDLFGGERLLVPALESLGWHTSIRVWDDPKVDWTQFDLVLVRCLWDYHQKLAQFEAWLARLKELGVKVVNDIDTMRWNLDKRYLFQLADEGCRLIPGICVERGDARSLLQLLDELAVEEIVVKPVQSAGAWRTLRIHRGNAQEHEAAYAEWRQEQAFLVQTFMPEIVEEGEWSLVFFNGEYSHSLLKRAKQGDFRVQSDHGGVVEARKASVRMQEQASALLQKLDQRPCYARVDGVCRHGDFYLMELELIEPELFLEVDPQAAMRFAQAILAAAEN
ncbi:MAG: hypothetical protein E6Q34_09960 [Burkholderiaceae bacterium]|nr:MAG: hypothetical protein E6Q34_09960 [Burkholderiaceae bacterium]